jgi:hypothetical protein
MQMLVALARTKLHKLAVLRHISSSRLRERHPAEVFHAADRIPAEPLAVLRAYFCAKGQHAAMLLPMLPLGRVMLLRRLKGAPGAGGRARLRMRQQKHARSKHGWDAVSWSGSRLLHN